MTQFSLLPRIALLAGFALAMVQATGAMAQSVVSGSSFPSSTSFNSDTGYTPPPVVKMPDPPRVVIGTPQRNIPMPDMRAPVNPVAQTALAAQPRRVVLNRLENRLTTEAPRATANAVSAPQNRAASGRQLLESAQPIL